MALILLASLVLPALAEETEDELRYKEITLSTAEDVQLSLIHI